MKKIMAMVAASALLLTGCGQFVEESETNSPGTEVQTTDFIVRNVSEINILETGGEDGRINNWLISQTDSRNVVVLTDRMRKTSTYNISDEDFQTLTHIDFSDYIGVKADTENIADAIYYNIEIVYDDGTKDIIEVYIPDLWHKLYEIIGAYEPDVELPEPRYTDTDNEPPFPETGTSDVSSDDSQREPSEDIGEAYFKEVSKEDILLDEKHGLKYAKNQLLLSVIPETEKKEIKKLAEEIDAEIVGYIELTGDYQLEFRNDKTLDELNEIAGSIENYPVIDATLNIISDVTTADYQENDSSSDTTIEDGYIAVFHGGVGELTHQTYVYKNDDGYSYINTESHTVSWGSPQWEKRITDKGTANSKDEIVEIAKENGANQYVEIPEDSNIYKIKDFLTMDW